MNNAISTQTNVELASRVKDLSKVYYQGGEQIVALNKVDLDLKQGEFLAIMGPSGSGKSTLLQCWATLDGPTSGYIEIAGQGIMGMSDAQLTKLRRTQIGFIFQAFNLIPTLNAQDNILLPLIIAGQKITPDHRQWFEDVIKSLGISDRLKHLPHQLSGGQQQRVAVARALVSRPQIIFADEPSGNLDTKSSNDLLELLSAINEQYRQSIVMVTHSVNAASYASRVIFLKDGVIFDQLLKPTTQQITNKLNLLEK